MHKAFIKMIKVQYVLSQHSILNITHVLLLYSESGPY